MVQHVNRRGLAVETSKGRIRVPIKKKYTYLGVVVSYTLDHEFPARARASTMRNGVSRAMHLLRNTSMGVCTRRMVARMQLYPLSYGVELFAFQMNPCMKFGRVVQSIVRSVTRTKHIPGTASFAEQRELRLPPIFALGAALALRAYAKFKLLPGPIGRILRETEGVRNQWSWQYGRLITMTVYPKFQFVVIGPLRDHLKG